jgi:hypothetical protein
VDFSINFLRKRIEEKFNFSDAAMFAQMLDDMLVAIQEETRDIAKRKGRDYDDYGATLHALVAGNDFIAYMHVGDGVLVYRDDQGKYRDPAKNGHYHLPCIPIKGEYDNETVFFNCDDDARRSAKTFYLPCAPSFFSLATDGIEKVALLGRKENWKPHPSFFVYLSSLLDTDDPEKALREFLLDERIEERTNDDRTIIFAKWGTRGDENYSEKLNEKIEAVHAYIDAEITKINTLFAEAEKNNTPALMESLNEAIDLLNACIDGEIAQISEKIAEAEKNNDDALVKSLIEERGHLNAKRRKI